MRTDRAKTNQALHKAHMDYGYVIYVRLFASKGGNFMVNESFSVLSEHERSSKLRMVLKNRSEGRINESEIRAVMDVISLKKQYAIRIYIEPDEFRKSLVLADPSRSKTVFGSAIAGVPGLSERFFPGTHAAAYITKNNVDIIHIYIPQQRMGKGED